MKCIYLNILSRVLMRNSFPYLFQIISAISSGITDISFDAVGYAWQFSNCILTASYSVSSNYYVLEISLVLVSSEFWLTEFSLCCSLLYGESWMKQRSIQDLDLWMKFRWSCWIICYLYLLLPSWLFCLGNGNTWLTRKHKLNIYSYVFSSFFFSKAHLAYHYLNFGIKMQGCS